MPDNKPTPSAGHNLGPRREKRAFGAGVDVVLLDDSGPPMRQELVPPCLQEAFRATWGLDETLPAGCTDCFGDDTFMDTEHADQRFGLISSDADFVIRSFWSFGNNDCAQIDGILPGFYPASKFEDGVVDVRDTFASDTMAVFMPSGTRHVWLSDAAGPSTSIGGSPTILEWVEQLVEGDPDWLSWPE